MDLEDALQRQGRLITRAQLASARRLTGDGRRLLRVRRGVHTDLVLADLTSRAAAVLQVRAARLVSDVDLVAAGATAALVHDLPLLGPPPLRVHVVERKQDRPRHHGTSATSDAHEVVHRGVPVTSLSRTAFVVARARGHLAGVLLADAVLARGEQPEELVVPGRDASTSWEEHRTVAEADGALKYASAKDLFAEKRREDRLRDAGWEVVRCTWDEALHRPEAVAARVRRAFERSASRRTPASPTF